MNYNLQNKNAIVTGGSRGIGWATAELLAAQGMNVIVAARPSQEMNLIRERASPRLIPFECDLSNPDLPPALVAFAVSTFGGLDLLVNNVGATKRGNVLQQPLEEWVSGFQLKFYSTLECTRAAWPSLRTRQGAVVNIIGVGGRFGSAEFGVGGAVNAALMNLTKTFADQGMHDGVRVNAINPGYIRTDRLQGRIRKLMEAHKLSEHDAEQKMLHEMGARRFGEPEEIARVVAFFASEMASYCQGSIMDVDGGFLRSI